MSDKKDDLRSSKVYKFNNTNENWNEFALKFRVIADSRGYEDIIYGTVTPPPPPPPPPPYKKEIIEVLPDGKVPELKAKKEKLAARLANKKGYRDLDLVMSTEGISLNIVESATSDKLSKGDLRKAWGKLERRWNPKPERTK